MHVQCKRKSPESVDKDSRRRVLSGRPFKAFEDENASTETPRLDLKLPEVFNIMRPIFSSQNQSYTMSDDSRDSTAHAKDEPDSAIRSRVENLREELTQESTNEQPGWTEWFEFGDFKDSMLPEEPSGDSKKQSGNDNIDKNGSNGSGNLKQRVTALRQELPDQSDGDDSQLPNSGDKSSEWTNFGDFNQFEDSVR